MEPYDTEAALGRFGGHVCCVQDAAPKDLTTAHGFVGRIVASGFNKKLQACDESFGECSGAAHF